jgi:AcrR family transcriptional regulator
VSIGTFYDHFENKADLLLQVAEQASETLPMPDPATLPQLEQSIAALTAAPSAGVSRAWLEAIRIEPGLFAASERLRGVFFGRYTPAGGSGPPWTMRSLLGRSCRCCAKP